MKDIQLPKFSIVTVCKNSPNLDKTCESIVEQTYKNYEWIVIDGGSEQNVRSILEKYKQSMDYFVSENDDGIYDAMNKGISKSTGDYIIFMNGGDYFIYPYILENANFMLEKYPYVDVLYGEECVTNHSDFELVTYTKNEQYLDEVLFKSTIRHQASFIRRSCFIDCGYYDITLSIVSDWKFFVVLHKNNKKFLKWNTIVACCTSGGISSNLDLIKSERKKVISELYTPEEIFGFYKNIIQKCRMKIIKK